MRLNPLNANHSEQPQSQQSTDFDRAIEKSSRNYKSDHKSSKRKTDELFASGADLNGNGKLEARELAIALNIDIKSAQAIIKQFDKDGDGELNRAETKGFFDALQAFVLATAEINAGLFVLDTSRPDFLRDLVTTYLGHLNKRELPID